MNYPFIVKFPPEITRRHIQPYGYKTEVPTYHLGTAQNIADTSKNSQVIETSTGAVIYQS